MSLVEALTIIQRAERGRNARIRTDLLRNVDRNRVDAQKNQLQNREAAALSIQKFWRGVLRARRANEQKQAELVFLGLAYESVHGKSLLPVVQTQVNKEVLASQKKFESQRLLQVQSLEDQLRKSFYVPGKTCLEAIALPHRMQLSLCPLGCQNDPGTCDPLESIYSLSRQIDRVNLEKHAQQMQNYRNLLDSALPIQSESIKRILIRQAAEFMLSPEYQNILAKRRVGAIIHTNRAIYQADKDAIQQEIELDEAEELKAELRKRHWAAINKFVTDKQTEDPENPKVTIQVPKEPLVIQTLEEQELMDQVQKEDEKLAGGKKKGKKGKKGKKDKKAKDEAPAEGVDEKAQHLSSFLADLVDATVEYFIHWQRHEQKDDQTYDGDFVKELFRPRVFKQVFESIWLEVRDELAEMIKNSELIASMEKGKKSKKKAAGKKVKGFKTLVYVPPPLVGPVGDQEVEKAFAELVSEGIIKQPKPATFNDIVICEQFMAPASKQTLLMKREAEAALGKKLSDEEKRKKEAEEEAEAHLAPLSLSNIRSTLIHNIVLPLSNPSTSVLLGRATSILLFGAPGCGKTLFARAIATELGALFVDLSPANLIGKFPVNDVEYLFSLIKKVILVNTPAVIYVDEVELIVGTDKKKGKKNKPKKGDDGQTPGQSMCAEGYPKTANPDYAPGRIRKQLQKLIDSIAPEQGIVVIGNATYTVGREKSLDDHFKQLIYIPLPDYATRLKLISHYMSRLGLSQYSLIGVGKDMRILNTQAVQKDEIQTEYSAMGLMGLQKGVMQQGQGTGKYFDISALAKATEGLTAGQIERVICETLSPSRIANLGQKPLDVSEFTASLSKQIPQFDSVIAHDKLFGMNKVPQRKDPAPDKKKK